METLSFSTQQELASALSFYGINHTNWPETKGLPKLWEEYIDGEPTFFIGEHPEDGRETIMRAVSPFNSMVYYEEHVLKEVRQEFPNGKVVLRNAEFSVSGGVKRGETAIIALRREMEEELGISWHAIQVWENYIVNATGVSTSLEMPKSYLGLPCLYTRNTFDIFLTKEQFNPNGYVEVQRNPDGSTKKSTYFEWFLLNQ